MKLRTKRSVNIALIEFLRPGYSWPYPYSIEIAFQALRYLIASASGVQYVTHHYWHSSCAVGLMGGAGAVNGECRPVKSLADLRSRFHSAILARDVAETARWRADKGIHVGAVIGMKFRHYKTFSPPPHLPWKSEGDIVKAVSSLLEESPGKHLTHQLNPVHEAAKVIHSVDITVGAEGFHVTLRYGFTDPSVDKSDSEWGHILASTEGDEPFLDTFARAIAEYERLTTLANQAKLAA